MDLQAAAVANMVAWWERVALARGGFVHHSEFVAVLDGLGTNPITNRAVVLTPDADSAAVAAVVRETFDRRAGGVIGLLDPWDHVALHGDGWSDSATVILPEMIYPSTSTRPPNLGDIRVVEGADALLQFEDVTRRGFDFVRWDDTAILPPSVLGTVARAFIAYDDGEPVACAIAHDYAGVTGVYLVATLPAARGRGFGEAVSWAATAAFGAQPATLQASEMGGPVYARMGYETTRLMRLWIRERNS
ncbi:MAG: hypothetical protein QOI61_1302 [Actinomycetota bacterium]